mmetsp:Transcript_13917/g.21603  ORF Transcript_13917/g.21603 Transcript_13917/m.21603 type:complete len:745 (-) Transcript_13917:98-2332(-)
MSSFAEQLAARAAKRTGSDSAPTSSIPSPSRRIIGEKNNNNGSSTIGSSPSRTAASLSEQIKSRAVDRNNSGGRSKSGDDNGRAEKKSTTATTDETLKSSTQQIIQKQSPLAIKKSSSSSSRSKRTNETNNNPSSSKVSAAKVPQQQQRRRADDLDSLFNETDTNDESTSYIPAKLHATKSRSPSPQIPSSTSDSATARTASPEQTKLKAKLDKYKSENKKLRHESLLLKAKLEEMASLLTKLQQLESGHKVENEELKVRVGELTQKVLQLEMSKLNNGGEEDDEYEWNGIRSSIRKLREERSVQQQRRASLTTTTTTTEEGRMSALSVDTFAEMDKEDLVAENVRLTQLMLDMEGLDELQKLANAQNGGSNYGGKNGRNDTSSGGGDEEKDAAISALNKKVSQIEDELTEVTELKNAEIDVLRKQLNRVEQQQHNRNNNSNNNNNNSPQDATANMEQQQQQWNKEREELREEIRRLNLEVSRQMSNRLDQEEEDDNARYNGTSSSSSTSLFITSPKNLDNSDISSLQSIIGMMRQTIDQSTKEKEELEQRLAEEQERSQNELKAFAKTLEGVDDLRKSAETMSREIRRIKVKGYRPTRSDLMGGGGDLNGVRNFGELTAAVEASENMEDAIRLIEGQNDALEERRRMGVVAASQSLGGGAAAAAPAPAPAPQARKGSIGLRAITEDDNDEGGFLSFWNGAGRTTNDDEEDDNDNDGIAKREKKKKSKRKKKRDDEGSVFTSFF